MYYVFIIGSPSHDMVISPLKTMQRSYWLLPISLEAAKAFLSGLKYTSSCLDSCSSVDRGRSSGMDSGSGFGYNQHRELDCSLDRSKYLDLYVPEHKLTELIHLVPVMVSGTRPCSTHSINAIRMLCCASMPATSVRRWPMLLRTN